MSIILRRRGTASPRRGSTTPDIEHVLIVVAHQDDDLYFMSPDILGDIDARKSLVVLYLTAGDNGNSDPAYWQGRETGVRAAYSQMTRNSDPWVIATEDVAGKTVHVASTPGVKHVYVRTPDGGANGAGNPSTGNVSLDMLWSGEIGQLGTVDGSNTFTKAQLLNLIRAVSDRINPAMVRTLDGHAATNDHPDHRTASRLTSSALAGGVPALTAYQGYGIAGLPVNVAGDLYDRKMTAMNVYAAHDAAAQPVNTEWVKRLYTTDSVAPVLPVSGPGGGGLNLAMSARILVSSHNAADSQFGSNAIDGVIDGYPGEHTKEWATLGEHVGAWIELRWDTPQTISRVTLYDRPNSTDNITGGVLTFSSGSPLSVGGLSSTGTATDVNFSSRTITWLRFTTTSGAGTNTGLAEIQVYAT